MEEDIRHIYVIIEDLNGKFDFMLELMRMMNTRMETFATKEYVNSLIQKQEIANMAIKSTNVVVNDHEMRIGALESFSRQTLTKLQ